MEHPGALTLLDALDADAPLAQRLQGFLDAALTWSGAAGIGARIEVSPEMPITLTAGDLSAARAAELAAAGSAVALGEHGFLVAESADADALAFAARLLERELLSSLRDLRRSSDDQGIAFISHQMGNRLMPILCNEEVASDAKELRGLIDLLRHLRGRIMLRDVVQVSTYLETLKGFLRHRRSGGFFDLQVEIDEAAGRRAVGPEQTGLLPELLHLGYLARGLAASEAPVRLVASVSDEGPLELTYSLTLADPREAIALRGRGCPDGSEPILALEGDQLRVGFRLLAQPSVVVLDVAPPAHLAARLAEAGIEVRRASGADDALAEALRPPQPWVVLVADEAWPTARGLKRQLAIQIPALAMRCYRLGSDGLPVGYEAEGPDHLDLRKLLRA